MVWVTVSAVVITWALAWNWRCAIIRFTSWEATSTLEFYNAPDCIRPKLEVPDAPSWTSPEAWVSDQLVSPI